MVEYSRFADKKSKVTHILLAVLVWTPNVWGNIAEIAWLCVCRLLSQTTPDLWGYSWGPYSNPIFSAPIYKYTNISSIYILRLVFGDLRSGGSCSNLRPSVRVPALSPRCKDSTSPPWILPVVWFVLFPIQPPFRDRFGCGNDCFVEGGGDLFSVDYLLCQNIQQWLRGTVFSWIQCVVLFQLFSIIG